MRRPSPNDVDFSDTVRDVATTSSREQIAENVRVAMTRRRVTVREISGVLGKSQAAASDRVNGNTHFRVDELQLVAAHLDVPLEQLLEPAESEVSA